MGWRARQEAKLQTIQNLNMLLIQRQQLAAAEQQARALQQIAAPGSVPAGWYPDPADARWLLWWDGRQWWPGTRRRP